MTTTFRKTCFVIMPFGDMPGYDAGHFSRVYEHLVRPACLAAGLDPIRGDEVKGTNYIAIDILQRILKSDIVVCDLSGKNANVMYELGIRQAFDLPVVLVKDKRTERVFDIQGLRTLDYTETLRVDSVQQDGNALQAAIEATLKLETHEVNSLVRLLGIEKAALGKPTEVTPETALILASLKDISGRLAIVEESSSWRAAPPPAVKPPIRLRRPPAEKFRMSNGSVLTVGETLYDGSLGNETVGTLISVGRDGLTIKPESGELFVLAPDDPRWETLSDIPF